jgi:hypothetical protein
MSSLKQEEKELFNAEQKELIHKLWVMLDEKYREAKMISQDDPDYVEMKKCCAKAGITSEQIVSVEDVIINEYYMDNKEGKKYNVRKEILILCQPISLPHIRAKT